MAKRTLLECTGTSCDWTTKWVACDGLSGPATLLIGIAIETCRPERTRPAASRPFSGVSRFIVPRSSSGPQRPQFLTDSKIASNSATPTLLTATSVRPRVLHRHLRLRQPVAVAAGVLPDEHAGADQEPADEDQRRVLDRRVGQRDDGLVAHVADGDARDDRDHDVEQRVELVLLDGPVVPDHPDVREDVHEDQPQGDGQRP